jgi:hypothetical protein
MGTENNSNYFDRKLKQNMLMYGVYFKNLHNLCTENY